MEGPKQLDHTGVVVASQALEDSPFVDDFFRNIGTEHFESVEMTVLARTHQPDSRKATGAQLVDDSVLVDLVVDVDGVVASGHVLVDILDIVVVYGRRRGTILDLDVFVAMNSSWTGIQRGRITSWDRRRMGGREWGGRQRRRQGGFSVQARLGE